MNEQELKEWMKKRGYTLRKYRKLKNRSYISWVLDHGDLKGQVWVSIPIEELPENRPFMESFIALFPIITEADDEG